MSFDVSAAISTILGGLGSYAIYRVKEVDDRLKKLEAVNGEQAVDIASLKAQTQASESRLSRIEDGIVGIQTDVKVLLRAIPREG